MGCNCTNTASRFVLAPRVTSSTASTPAKPPVQEAPGKKKSCPKCYTYKAVIGSGVVRCPICHTVFAT